MKQPITQEHNYGCGVSCFAFVSDVTYKEAVELLGRELSVRNGWRPTDLVRELTKQGLTYRNKYVRKTNVFFDKEGTIVLVEPSANYPVGHYLAYHEGKWMDPWINLPDDTCLEHAQSGFRDRLPGKAMYALIPEQK